MMSERTGQQNGRPHFFLRQARDKTVQGLFPSEKRRADNARERGGVDVACAKEHAAKGHYCETDGSGCGQLIVFHQPSKVDKNNCEGDHGHGDPNDTRENGSKSESASAHFAAELTLQSDKEAYRDGHTESLEDGEKEPVFRVIHEPLHLASQQHY